MRREESFRVGIVVGDDDQIESSSVSELVAENPAMGSPSSHSGSKAGVEGDFSHLFSDAMKLQLRAQILVLGDLLKGIPPSQDWLEEACLEPVKGSADLPITSAAIKDELHAPGRLLSPGEPSSGGKQFHFRADNLAQETDAARSGHLMITYDHTTPARSNSNVAEDDFQATEIRGHDNDKHLDLAQASAQDALTTATSALAQSHLVWARLHSQDHSEEGAARDARIASVAATVAAAASVAKAAVEAARAIAEVSMDAFIQAGSYHAGDTTTRVLQFGSTRSKPLQVADCDRSPNSNTRDNPTPSSQQRVDMVESVVQAAGKAAEAASQAGAVLAKANPMIQGGGLSEFWSRRLNEADAEHEGNECGEIHKVNGMDAVNDVDGFDGGDEVDALNEMDAVDEVNELDGMNEEDALVEAIQEVDAVYQDKLDAANEIDVVHEDDFANQEAVEAVVAAANVDEDVVAAANEDDGAVVDEIVVDAASGDQMITANGDEIVAVNEGNEVAVTEAEVVVANERDEPKEMAEANEAAGPSEHEFSITLRSHKLKRGRERSQAVPSRAKRYKSSVRVSSASLLAQTPQDATLKKADVPNTGKISGDENARGNTRVAKHMGFTPVSTSGKDIPATSPAQTPENEPHRKDDALKSRKYGRDEYVKGEKRGANHVEHTPASTSGKYTSATTLAQTPENVRPKKDDVPISRMDVSDESARGKTRGAKPMENSTMNASGKDTAERDLGEVEADRNTRGLSENTAEGSAVEVMTDELGLRGGWFSGKVLRMTPNEAFVELHDLLTDDGKANVREWFPLVEGFTAYRPRRHVRPVHPFSIITEAGSRKRRRVALGSQTWHIGDHVDAFFQDAWWEGIVAELHDLEASKVTIYFPEENDTQVVKTWDLRPSFQWKDNKWIPWKNPALVEGERPQKRPKTGGLKKQASKDGPDEFTQKSNNKFSKKKTERTKLREDYRIMAEPTSAKNTHKSEESKVEFRSRRSDNKKSSQKQNRSSTTDRLRPHQKDVLSPGTPKKLDFTTDAITPIASTKIAAAQGDASTRGKLRPRRNRDA